MTSYRAIIWILVSIIVAVTLHGSIGRVMDLARRMQHTNTITNTAVVRKVVPSASSSYSPSVASTISDDSSTARDHDGDDDPTIRNSSSSSSSSSNQNNNTEQIESIMNNDNDNNNNNNNPRTNTKTTKTTHVRILIQINTGFTHFFWNWWLHYDRVMKNQSPHQSVHITLVLLGEDPEVFVQDPGFQELLNNNNTKDSKNSHTRIILERSNLTVQAGPMFNIGMENYVKMMEMRPIHIGKHLVDALAEADAADKNNNNNNDDDAEGASSIIARRVWVIHIDLDTVWNSFPLSYLDDAPENDANDMDIWAQMDGGTYDKPYYGCGFLAFRPTPQVRRFVDLWGQVLSETPKIMDQIILNRLLVWNLRNETKHMLKEEGLPPLRHRGLPFKLFPSGLLYFFKSNDLPNYLVDFYESNTMTEADRERAVVVHANYMTGGIMKREQLMKHGLWLLNDTELRGKVNDTDLLLLWSSQHRRKKGNKTAS